MPKEQTLSEQLLENYGELREDPRWELFVDSLSEAFQQFVTRVDDWADHLKGPVNPVTPGGGVVIDFLNGLLDPDVWKGVKAIKESADADGDTRGLTMSPQSRTQLHLRCRWGFSLSG